MFSLKRRREPKEEKFGPPKWSMGVLNDTKTVEVPGSVLLLARNRNEPLGLRNAPARNSHSSIPSGFVENVETPPSRGRRPSGHMAPAEEKKKTKDGKIILEPQPDESENDPLNWPTWRRDSALLSLGFYCMLGGGVTPILAAGFTNVAEDYDVHVETVALTTGLYMMGLGLGSVVASPTAILYGKRPVYLVSAIIFIVTSIWAALSPNFTSLVVARIFQGMSVSPVECLPSATIAEIFFLHERAYRIGIYTLLLLGGKNLVPLVSAAIIETLGWRWVFWIISFVAAFGVVMLFLFVPETFWDRKPVPRSRKPSRTPSFMRRLSMRRDIAPLQTTGTGGLNSVEDLGASAPASPQSRSKTINVGSARGSMPGQKESHSGATEGEEPTLEIPRADHQQHKNLHVGFAPVSALEKKAENETGTTGLASLDSQLQHSQEHHDTHISKMGRVSSLVDASTSRGSPGTGQMEQPFSLQEGQSSASTSNAHPALAQDYFERGPDTESEKLSLPPSDLKGPPRVKAYTHTLRHQPAKSFVQQLKPWHGRLNHDNWFKVCIRPLILFSYPAVLWSSLVYSCSIGWLIVISESMAMIYRNKESYNFDALQTGLVYLSPFIGGILGTAVAGKVSDIIVRALARRNGGLYEPEFRLIMAGPVLVSTVIGLMGFGWSVEERDHWIVPTVFFGIISFGCSLGSATSITFCVDSYRQYAGEALVTLNFSKNIFHGLIFSLFVTHWLTEKGPKSVFIWIGVIQLIVLLTTIPMYIYGKRARMWTVRKNFMEKF